MFSSAISINGADGSKAVADKGNAGFAKLAAKQNLKVAIKHLRGAALGITRSKNMSQTFIESVTLEKITCGGCGITFAIPETMLASLHREAGSFYCPNGHRRGWSETEADRLKKQLEAVQTQLRASKCETLNAQNKSLEIEAKRIQLEKKFKRVKNGVCPCCNRSFVNLQRHMLTKHAENLPSK